MATRSSPRSWSPPPRARGRATTACPRRCAASSWSGWPARSEDAGHLVEIAAVAGREVEHDVLAEVCGLSEADLSRALHEALDAQLLFVAGAGATSSATPSVTRSCRKRPTTSSCRPSDGCSMAPTPARSRRGRPAPARRRPTASSSSPTTGRRPRNRPWRCTPRSVPATRRRPSTPTPRRRASTSARPSCGTSCPPPDRPTDRDLADIFDSAASAAIVIGDAARAVSLARKAIELVDAAPDAAADPRATGARPRAARLRLLAGRRHRDVDPAARGSRGSARRHAAVDRAGAGAGGPCREPDARGTGRPSPSRSPSAPSRPRARSAKPASSRGR